MEFWTQVWTWTLILSLGGFALLAIVVTRGGWKDLRELLQKLERAKRDADSR